VKKNATVAMTTIAIFTIALALRVILALKQAFLISSRTKIL